MNVRTVVAIVAALGFSAAAGPVSAQGAPPAVPYGHSASPYGGYPPAGSGYYGYPGAPLRPPASMGGPVEVLPYGDEPQYAPYYGRYRQRGWAQPRGYGPGYGPGPSGGRSPHFID
jgi:hypothetical protein